MNEQSLQEIRSAITGVSLALWAIWFVLLIGVMLS